MPSLRFPSDCTLRPAITGWFAEFGELSAATKTARVVYNTGHDRFAGATYDPTSHYRAAAVFSFFAEQELTPELLRQVSQTSNRLVVQEIRRARSRPPHCQPRPQN